VGLGKPVSLIRLYDERKQENRNMAIPERFKPEQDAVEALIRGAFRGVTREGGISWSEADELSCCADEATLAAARARDVDRQWEDLVDDASWRHNTGGDEWLWLDAIGFRYYLAPAMIRCTRDPVDDELFLYAMQIHGELKEDQVRLLTRNQKHVAARFVRLMTAIETLDPYSNPWSLAYRLHWRQWDRGGLST